MGLILELKKGFWYRDGKYTELSQVKQNINFLNNKKIEIAGNKIEVGRNTDNDIILDSNYVSRSHCQIRKGGFLWTVWYIKDFKSKYGTIIFRSANKEGDQYIQLQPNKEFALKLGDLIVLGNISPVNLLVVNT